MFTSAKKIKPHVKVLIMGPSGTGKTHGGLELPGRIAGFDMEDGLYPFSHHPQFDFDLDRDVENIDDLNKKIRTFLDDKNIQKEYETLILDGVTKLWHEVLREAESSNGTIGFTKQREVKSGGKELTDLIMDLGRINKNVWVTVQAKVDWEIGRDNKPVPKGMKGDMDQRLFYAFDLVFYLDIVDGSRTATVLKSRFPQFVVGGTLPNFEVKTYLKPIFDGPSSSSNAPLESSRTEMASAEQKERLKALGQELGSASRGGRIPNDTANKVNALIKGGGTSSEANDLIEELESLRTPETV